jgi:hypothetical protein
MSWFGPAKPRRIPVQPRLIPAKPRAFSHANAEFWQIPWNLMKFHGLSAKITEFPEKPGSARLLAPRPSRQRQWRVIHQPAARP